MPQVLSVELNTQTWPEAFQSNIVHPKHLHVSPQQCFCASGGIAGRAGAKGAAQPPAVAQLLSALVSQNMPDKQNGLPATGVKSQVLTPAGNWDGSRHRVSVCAIAQVLSVQLQLAVHLYTHRLVCALDALEVAEEVVLDAPEDPPPPLDCEQSPQVAGLA